MKRRSFLQALAALIATPVPKVVASLELPVPDPEPVLPVEWVEDELKPAGPIVRTVDIFISEFGELRIDKLADTDDWEKYQLRGMQPPFPDKMVMISPSQGSMDKEALAEELAYQIERRAGEMIKDLLFMEYGSAWREKYNELIAKYAEETGDD